MRCPTCDQLLPDTAHVCTTCGATLVSSTSPSATAAEPPTQRLTPPAPASASAPSAPVVSPSQPAMPPAPAVSGLAAAPAGMAPAVATGVPVQQVNVTVQTAPMPVVVMSQAASGPGCLARSLYFLVVGWWFSQIWIWAAWVLNLTILGLPLGLMMLNRLPQVVTLKPVRSQTQVSVQGGAVVIGQGQIPQHPFWLRALYFALVGWWLSLAWVQLAWLATVSLIGLPLAFWMFDRVPAITTLARR